MLYFLCFHNAGFVKDSQGSYTNNVREALPFKSFKEADDFGRAIGLGNAYAVLANCGGNPVS
jgi:hypothetical protein